MSHFLLGLHFLERYFQFKSNIHQLFPEIIDTKHLSLAAKPVSTEAQIVIRSPVYGCHGTRLPWWPVFLTVATFLSSFG